MPSVAVIIVTHNSEAVLGRCLSSLAALEIPAASVIVVDAGSTHPEALDALTEPAGLAVIRAENVGFSRANNIGYGAISPEVDYVAFINPDVFVEPQSISRALAILAAAPRIGCLAARLLGYSIEQGQPTGLLDSAGIARAWYGRWHDRGQGQPATGRFTGPEEVEAGCGAFLFCRRAALDSIRRADGAVFDPDFFLYKEDIELSLRLRRQGWGILYHPEVTAFHCRGWDRRRGAVPYRMRLLAAANELLLYRKHPSPYMLWAFAKYLLVRFLRL